MSTFQSEYSSRVINQSINQSITLFQAAWPIKTQDRQDRQVLTDNNKSKNRE